MLRAEFCGAGTELGINRELAFGRTRLGETSDELTGFRHIGESAEFRILTSNVVRTEILMVIGHASHLALPTQHSKVSKAFKAVKPDWMASSIHCVLTIHILYLHIVLFP